MAGAFGGLMATGLTKIPRWGAHGSQLHTWRNIFFFEGLITIIVGALAPLLLPKNPETCKFLNEREKAIAVGRMALESKGVCVVFVFDIALTDCDRIRMSLFLGLM
jgi:hypothetical protein